jgi:hypothetical protein
MENEYIQVTKFVMADLVIIEKKIGYNGDMEYTKTSFLFSEGLFTMIRCNEQGEVEKYRSVSYGACKLDEDVVLFMDSSCGWSPHRSATKAWANKIAEKELLDVATSNGKK